MEEEFEIREELDEMDEEEEFETRYLIKIGYDNINLMLFSLKNHFYTDETFKIYEQVQKVIQNKKPSSKVLYKVINGKTKIFDSDLPVLLNMEEKIELPENLMSSNRENHIIIYKPEKGTKLFKYKGGHRSYFNYFDKYDKEYIFYGYVKIISTLNLGLSNIYYVDIIQDFNLLNVLKYNEVLVPNDFLNKFDNDVLIYFKKEKKLQYHNVEIYDPEDYNPEDYRSSFEFKIKPIFFIKVFRKRVAPFWYLYQLYIKNKVEIYPINKNLVLNFVEKLKLQKKGSVEERVEKYLDSVNIACNKHYERDSLFKKFNNQYFIEYGFKLPNIYEKKTRN